MGRKPQNFNDVDSKFERGVGELHAKLRGRGVLAEVSGRHQSSRPHCLAALEADPDEGGGRDQGFRVPELCAAGAIGIE